MYTYNFFSLVFLCFLVTKNWKITGMNKPLKCYGFLQLDYFFQESYFECFHPQVSMTLHLLLLFLLFPAAFTQTDVYSIIFWCHRYPGSHFFMSWIKWITIIIFCNQCFQKEIWVSTSNVLKGTKPEFSGVPPDFFHIVWCKRFKWATRTSSVNGSNDQIHQCERFKWSTRTRARLWSRWWSDLGRTS